jgi:hypothetical protein
MVASIRAGYRMLMSGETEEVVLTIVLDCNCMFTDLIPLEL